MTVDSIATLHFTNVGVGVVRLKLRRWVDTHWNRGMSYLKIGWSWLRQQFRRGWPPMPAFWLDPAPDFETSPVGYPPLSDPMPAFWLDLAPDLEPAVASRRKAAQPN